MTTNNTGIHHRAAQRPNPGIAYSTNHKKKGAGETLNLTRGFGHCHTDDPLAADATYRLLGLAGMGGTTPPPVETA